MKVALLSAFMFDNSIGGVENHIRFMCKELKNKGYEITLFKPVWEEKDKEYDTKFIDGIELRYVVIGKKPIELNRFYGKGNFGYLTAFINKAMYNIGAKKLFNEVSNYSPDFVWQHDFSSSWWATKKLSKSHKIILTNHTGEYLFFQKKMISRVLVKQLLKHYSAIIGPSIELTPTNYLKESFTIHNGVDQSIFFSITNEEKLTLKHKIFSNHVDKFIIFCPRRWAPTKGVKYFAKAIRILEERIDVDKLLFVFAGDKYSGYPLYTEEVNNILEGSNANIIRMGNLGVEEISKIYQVSDLVIIPSLMEAVSLSAVEAMACGTPVVSSKVGGMPEIIKDGETGFFIEPADSNSLAETIMKLLNDQDKLSYVSKMAYSNVTKNYGWDKIANETEKVWNNIKF